MYRSREKYRNSLKTRWHLKGTGFIAPNEHVFKVARFSVRKKKDFCTKKFQPRALHFASHAIAVVVLPALPLCPPGAVVMDQPAMMAEQAPLAGIGGDTLGGGAGAGCPLLQMPER